MGKCSIILSIGESDWGSERLFPVAFCQFFPVTFACRMFGAVGILRGQNRPKEGCGDAVTYPLHTVLLVSRQKIRFQGTILGDGQDY